MEVPFNMLGKNNNNDDNKEDDNGHLGGNWQERGQYCR